jgi:Seven in absentia protein family
MNESLVLNFNINQCLECPVCMDFLCVPVFQCSNGHSICGQCTAKIDLEVCPICRIKLTKNFRNYSLEKILDNITTNCRFEGCKEVINLSKRAEHQNHCRFNMNIECTFPDCYWSGPDLCLHLKTIHSIKEFNMNNHGTRGWNSKTWRDADWGFSIWNFNGRQILNQSISNKNFFFLWVYNIQEEPVRLKLAIGSGRQKTEYNVVTTCVKKYKKEQSMPLHMNISEIEKYFLEPAEGLDEGYKRLTIEVKIIPYKSI